ncbi:translation initiation factor IF-3 [Candidatus Nomurabacteria bacterium RIFCSPHIGHO2_02_FULL_41_18]|uniref:Translation initiation factor IF-3 n=1 Tax=Candidatus Nomurabacteria bacterium RIFCSPHIGHO2_02_FULL_41_18 TaxID=1801754 RepID=A0A1F6W640_9BACT|nr:MAG: translation initiation factor IF-3 [Candidatus Nomurabacteria bacterium RIFCSPHIGHO2_01_FULL_41_71]OGI77361.1 MAG: translation initiation factor IF-3 [Candidatus Nomurabacteria bacterium RIFCSPHIGHO2_02_FULL_41_18]OGI89759.1 MAG: translation initiation factor IF-3 [Candidatus Nomurabacteria bacterium RIFCSPLOWO2_01_FULL_41_52b]OGJ00340.1 MAG: translation initiation factor IF-3 [Candidatus Nomurabacteria bacterium RIFCSPLOWO2_02_FULL_41_9]
MKYAIFLESGYHLRHLRERINNQIRVKELRIIDNGNQNLGIMSIKDALELAQKEGLDLIEISPNSVPPIGKIMDFGKYQYEMAKKLKKAKAGTKATETKSIQVKIGTGGHDLELKSKTASKWLKEGHRIKIELFLSGRAKYMDEKFLRERLDRLLHLITEEYKISDPYKRGPKGLITTIERAK